MQLIKLLHKMFQKELPAVHKVRLNTLMKASETLINRNQLTLTALGRHLSSPAKTRSNIKRMDRLLGNPQLQKESVSFYKVMNAHLVGQTTQPWIHVDWSCLCSVTQLYVLRASLSMPGRSMVMYEECHPKTKENNHATHKAFLNHLQEILPPSVTPVMVTDAGFRAPWFAYVRQLGWNFVGRLRNKNAIQWKGHADWILSQSLYEKATSTPADIGEGVLTKEGKVPAHVVVYQGKSTSRSYKARSRRSGHRQRYMKAHQEPWVLVTSLTGSQKRAQHTVTLYRQRMRIEENFRDTKCTRYGFGLKESRSRSPERMKILLLIAAMATFACWLAGLLTKQKGKAAAYQAQSSKYTAILSMVYLGREALKKGLRLGTKQFNKVLQLLFHISTTAQSESMC